VARDADESLPVPKLDVFVGPDWIGEVDLGTPPGKGALQMELSPDGPRIDVYVRGSDGAMPTEQKPCRPCTIAARLVMPYASGTDLPRDCPCCGTPWQGRRVLGQVTAKASGPYHLAQCARCDLILLSPTPSEPVLQNLYVAHKQFTDVAYHGDRAAAANEFYLGRITALLNKVGAAGEPSHILEIGAGLSWISRAAKSFNPNSLTVAQDITSEVVDQCTWVDHYYVGELQATLSEIRQFAPYQVISMTHVIEHLKDPCGVLRTCKSLLDPKGIIFLTAPHRPQGWHRKSPFAVWQNWSYSHVPAHLQYFNTLSMKRCAEKVGLDVILFEAIAEEGQAFEAWLGH